MAVWLQIKVRKRWPGLYKCYAVAVLSAKPAVTFPAFAHHLLVLQNYTDW